MGNHGVRERQQADNNLRASRWFLFISILTQAGFLVYVSGGGMDRWMTGLSISVVISATFILGVLVERYQ